MLEYTESFARTILLPRTNKERLVVSLIKTYVEDWDLFQVMLAFNSKFLADRTSNRFESKFQWIPCQACYKRRAYGVIFEIPAFSKSTKLPYDVFIVTKSGKRKKFANSLCEGCRVGRDSFQQHVNGESYQLEITMSFKKVKKQ